MAVVMMPVPSGLVRTRVSPGLAAALVVTRSGSTSPVTANPYLGSASSTEWPPTIVHPAARHHIRPAADHLAGHLPGDHVPRPADQLEGGQGRSAHRVDVGEGVGGGDPPPVVCVVDHRCEEVDRLHERHSGRDEYTPASSEVAVPTIRSGWETAV
jgi:hypothetical protein